MSEVDVAPKDDDGTPTENFGGENSKGVMVLMAIAVVLIIAFIGVLIMYFVTENDRKHEQKQEEEKKDQLYRQQSLRIINKQNSIKLSGKDTTAADRTIDENITQAGLVIAAQGKDNNSMIFDAI